MESITKRLWELQDTTYRDFSAKLIPNVDKEKIIGIRTPNLRTLAKEVAKNEEECRAFLSILPHKFHEENCLHAFLIEQIKDYDVCLAEVKRFLPYINNWATCDTMRPKIFIKNKEKLLPQLYIWIQSSDTYTIRFGIEMLMSFFLDTDFRPEILERIAVIRSDEYYVNMMIAWFFATALAKQYETTLPYIEQMKLDTWTHSKTFQKSIESYRIDTAQKEYLKTLKRK